ncbi:hypothetical protein [Streptomyces sp. E5N91]|uniref:hypothetical protein n=1 Tax=Streptomyces sp. E5N91 TaxID=1851996 RepID=UPI000EF5663B|nr:hypothetical protein [Streptomyces sp. E5N91]
MQPPAWTASRQSGASAWHTTTRLEQWRTWYEQGHFSLQDITDHEGTSLSTARLAFLKNRVPLRPAGSYPRRSILS